MSALAAVAAYLLGSISFAILVSRAMRLPDPRSYGSGNPGATNVLRTGKTLAAVLTLAGDAGKGWLAVWSASPFPMRNPPPEKTSPSTCEMLSKGESTEIIFVSTFKSLKRL